MLLIEIVLKISMNSEEESNLLDDIWKGFLGEGLLGLLFFSIRLTMMLQVNGDLT